MDRIGPRWHSILTNGVPMLGDHKVTTPLPCPNNDTPLCGLCVIASHGPC